MATKSSVASGTANLDPTSGLSNLKKIDVKGDLTAMNKELTSIFSSVKLSTNTNFTGMNETEYQNFVKTIDNYIQSVKDVINGFKLRGDNPIVLQGKANSAMSLFVTNLQKLLGRYVDVLEQDKIDAQNALNRFKKGAKKIYSSVQNEAEQMGKIGNASTSSSKVVLD